MCFAVDEYSNSRSAKFIQKIYKYWNVRRQMALQRYIYFKFQSTVTHALFPNRLFNVLPILSSYSSRAPQRTVWHAKAFYAGQGTYEKSYGLTYSTLTYMSQKGGNSHKNRTSSYLDAGLRFSSKYSENSGGGWGHSILFFFLVKEGKCSPLNIDTIQR